MARRHRKHHRKHTRSRRRRHHNPFGGGGMIKGAMGAITGIGIPAALAGAASGFVKAKFLGKKSALIQNLVTVAEGVAAAVLLKRKPQAAAAAAGAIFGTIGFEQGIKMGGGAVLSSKIAGLAEAQELAEILNDKVSGLGTVVEMRSISDDGGEVGDADVDGMGEDEAA